jgi:hypothetical protein
LENISSVCQRKKVTGLESEFDNFLLLRAIDSSRLILVCCNLFPNQQKFRKRKDVNTEVKLLESNIKDQIRSNDDLLLLLRRLEQKVHETGKGVDELFDENPQVLDRLPNDAKGVLTDIHVVSLDDVFLLSGKTYNSLCLLFRTTLSSVFLSLRAIESRFGGISINSLSIVPAI